MDRLNRESVTGHRDLCTSREEGREMSKSTVRLGVINGGNRRIECWLSSSCLLLHFEGLVSAADAACGGE